MTMGLVGFGAIAQGVARVAQALGMNVIATRRGERPPEVPGVRIVDLDTLFRESDVLSVHCPLTPETKGLVNAARLGTDEARRLRAQHQPRPGGQRGRPGRGAQRRQNRRARAWTCSRPSRPPPTIRS